MFVVDTNVLIYAADADAPEHTVCRRHVERWRAQTTPWHTTWGVLYEFLRVVTHPRVQRNPWTTDSAWTFLKVLMAAPGLNLLMETERHGDVLDEVVRAVPLLAGNIVHDLHTAALMREHGIRAIVTRDTDFHRFPFVEVIDPLA